MFIVYTDDCIGFSKTKTLPDQLIKDLKDDGFLLKDEGDTRDFLGVTITRDSENQIIMMMQTGLIDSILFDLGLTANDEYIKIKDVPASQVLHPDKDGADRQEK